ncbi:hypothetical protein CSQ79_06825 [Gloeocapsopsis sp. IPPAS B-1203]|nr:hypothetical protein CSQ79_06825 [Gloeocapsopsis sp. IPPAS B-1203]
MLSLFMRKFHKIAAIALLILGILTGMPNAAQAETGISLNTTNEVVNVITVYPTTSNQAKVLSEVSQAEPKFSKTPGFQDSAILKAQDGTQVIALSQWKGKLSSFQSYAKEHVINVATQTPQTFACQVQHTETRTTSPSFNQGDVIMLSQFKMKPGQDQSELATIVTQEMPSVLQMIPGLQWAAMCPSTDKSIIALLARWNSRADFESLGQQPGFDKETNYWQTYADNEHGLYDVVKNIC